MTCFFQELCEKHPEMSRFFRFLAEKLSNRYSIVIEITDINELKATGNPFEIKEYFNSLEKLLNEYV